LKTRKGKELDVLFHQRHLAFFSKNNCLSCANCCKTTSPIFRDVDIKRISKHLKIKEKKFINKYLRVDEDHDYVLKSSPCPFLDLSDHSCHIYAYRPLACSEYPHTDRKNMAQILDITLRNALICPAVASIAIEIADINNRLKMCKRRATGA
jgi:Fe-S-cluster containining protein